MNNKIHQRGPFTAIELAAAGTISPGMLIEETSTGKLQAHSTAGGFGEGCYAQEDALQGRTTTDTYTVAGVGGVGPDMVQANIELPGNLGQALLKAGSNYPVGTKLISAGDGTLKPTTGTPSKIFAVIPKGSAVDLSASAAVNTLASVRYL